jgi:transposase
MKRPIPPLHDAPAEVHRRLKAERDAQTQQRLQALYLLQTQQARPRRQVARLLGVNRDTVGRWLPASAPGGMPQLLTIATAPGKPPLLSAALRHARRDRLAPPQGCASSKARWQWLRQGYGRAIAYKPVPRFVRYTLRAQLKVPRKSPIKKPLNALRQFRRLFPRCGRIR